MPVRREPLRREALQQALLAQYIFRSLEGAWGHQEADDLIEQLARAPEADVTERAKTAAAGVAHDEVLVKGTSGAERSASLTPGEEVIAVSAAMRAVLRQAEAYAAFPEAVLIRGETGTGKELVARRIHALSSRRDRPFVAVNCAAIPATLFEREFFGHRKGAYSGADDDTPGFVALADGGTLFLDEVGELPWELQPKLLRLLQDGTYTRLGDPRERRVDVRLLAATNADLDRLAEAGRFRQDLNYRLKVLELELPPLRERPDDIVPLLNHFLTRFSGKPAFAWTYFDESSIRALQQYSWPGNVREILMVARRAHIGLATDDHVNIQIATNGSSLTLTGPGTHKSRGPASRRRLLAALAEAEGNKAEAARQLGVSRQTLYRWLARLNLSAE